MMTALLDLLSQLLRRAGNSDEAREQAAFVAWVAAVGDPVRRVTAPVRLQRKTLVVAVKDSTWRNQLSEVSRQALFRLNSRLGSPIVTSIQFVIDPDAIDPPGRLQPQVTFDSPEERALPLRQKANGIPDSNIRDAFLRAAGKCLDRRAK